jgi:uncharacterized membrane protein YdfJ with MMPL/SSD domain
VFAWWGRTVYRYRFIVIGVMVALSLLGGIFGISLGKHVTQSGFYDDGSQSVKASVLGDSTYGRDRTSHIVATFTAPKSLNDPAWQHKIVDELNAFKKDHSDQVVGWAGWLAAPTSTDPVIKGMARQRRHHPDQLQDHRAGSAETERRQRPTRRAGADRQRIDRHHRD